MAKKLALKEAPISASSQATQSLTPEEKVELFDKGYRPLNLKACGLAKLITYYKIALRDNYTNASFALGQELKKRKYGDQVLPEKRMFIPDFFSLPTLEVIKTAEELGKPEQILAAYNSVNSRADEDQSYFLIALYICAEAMGATRVAKILKNTLKLRAFSIILPKYIKELMTPSGVFCRTLSKSLSELVTGD